jgi:hypothetical protein
MNPHNPFKDKIMELIMADFEAAIDRPVAFKWCCQFLNSENAFWPAFEPEKVRLLMAYN